MAYQRLGDILLSMGLITEAELKDALETQKTIKKRLGSVLVDSGVINEKQLIDALVTHIGVEFIDLSKVIIPAEMTQILSKNIAQKYDVVPVRVLHDKLYLAMCDPLNFVAIEEVKSATRKKIIPMIATTQAVELAILTLYGNESAARAIEEMKRESSNNPERDTTFISSDIDENIDAAPTIRFVSSIIERAIAERASDIHLEPNFDELRVRMRIDGVLHNILTVPKDLQSSVISRIKVMASMDISERKIPQDGRTNVHIKKLDFDLRVSTLPTIYGEKVVIRLLDKNSGLLDKSAIGLVGADLNKYLNLIKNPSGLVLIAGPTGSGKSSTMYTMIRELNSEFVNLVTLEDPVEYNIENVNQVQINEKTGMTFAGGLRSILRQDPDIIAVGEIRDGETAQIAMRASITGHLVLSTIHTNDSFSTIDRLADIGVQPYIVAAAMRGIISQRLVRKICPNCRHEYIPNPDDLEAIGLPPKTNIKFYRGSGCPMCFNAGYRGRTGVFEILMFTHEVREAVAMGLKGDQIQSMIKETDFFSLPENFRRLVLEG
ncbi:MAG: GspE/PulE family protein, partial [Clostridia bacterium]